MAIDYSKYPPNWKTEIRPAILERDGHKCKFCNIPNYQIACRGKWYGVDVWQDDDGNIYDASNSVKISESYVGDVFTSEKEKITRVVLTIAHLDHNTENNDYDNLAALCQRCHLNYDKEHHAINSRATIERKKGLQRLF